MKLTAINNLRPGALLSFDGAEITHYEHADPMPTEAEIDAEIARMQADHAAKKYQRDRKAAYPPIAEQLDIMFHGGLDAWRAAILAVKTAHPKP